MSWRREDHYAKTLPALGLVIDITPTPEQRVNRRVTKMELEAHQARRTVAFQSSRSEEVTPKVQHGPLVVKHGRIERMALEAANEALEPLARTWWARLSRRLRGLMGGR